MHIERAGRPGARPVLLVHGAGVAGWMWRPLHALLPEDLDLFIPDLPGHGASRDVPFVSRAQTVEDLSGQVRAEADRPLTVVGFSFGAQIAVELAARMPGLVDRAVIVSAQARPTPLPGLTSALVRAAAPLARNERFARAQAKELLVPDELVDDYLRTSRAIDGGVLARIVDENIRFRVPDAWGAFPGAATIMAGADERKMMLASARELHERLPGSALEIVDGCGHGIPLQRPERIAARIG